MKATSGVLKKNLKSKIGSTTPAPTDTHSFRRKDRASQDSNTQHGHADENTDRAISCDPPGRLTRGRSAAGKVSSAGPSTSQAKDIQSIDLKQTKRVDSGVDKLSSRRRGRPPKGEGGNGAGQPTTASRRGVTASRMTQQSADSPTELNQPEVCSEITDKVETKPKSGRGRGRPVKLRSPKQTKNVGLSQANDDNKTEEEEQPVGRRRGPGRPKKDGKTNKIQVLGDVPKMGRVEPTQGKKKGKVKEVKAASSDEDVNTMVQCRHCEQQLEAKSIKHHYMRRHARIYSKSNPEGDTGGPVWTKIIRALGSVCCPKCNKPHKFLHYFKFHIEWCGREGEMATCPLCSRRIQAMWARSHQLTCQRRQAELATVNESKRKHVEDQEDYVLPRKRKAAQRAVEKINEVVGENEETSDLSADLFISPPMLDLPSKELIDSWLNKLDKGDKRIRCPHEGCDKTSIYIPVAISHYRTCAYNGLEEHQYRCSICPHKNSTIIGIRKHVHRHKKIRDDDDRDFQAAEESSDNSDDCESDGNASDEVNRHFRTRKLQTPPLPRDALPSFNVKCAHPASDTLLPWYLPCAKQFNQTSVETSDLKQCSSTRNGGTFTFLHNQSDEPIKLADGQSESIMDGSVIVTNSGSPISHTAWCPTHTDIQTLKHQYAAVVRAHATNKAESILEIWAWSIEAKSSLKTPDKVVTFRQTLGRITKIKWTPRSSYLSNTLELPRLGLLAVASSDGNAYILSVPHVEPADGHRTSKLSEQITLVAGGEPVECLAIEWQKKDTNLVAAGYADGSVALYYIRQSEKTTVIKACRVFQAQLFGISDICWCPFDSDLFATFSHGWSLWHINDTNNPYYLAKDLDCFIEWTRAAVWPRDHSIIIRCQDPSLGFLPCHASDLSTVARLIEANQRRPLFGLVVPTAVDCCDCCQMLVGSDLSGSVIYAPIMPPPLRFERSTVGFKIKYATRVKLDKSQDSAQSPVRYNFLSFKIKNCRSTSDIDKAVTHEVVESVDPSHAIHSVSLNPNPSHHGWLICGGTDGLIQAIKLKS